MSDPAPVVKNPILQTMLMMVGQSNVITIHRPLVEFLEENLEAAMLLGQLLYWTPRSVMGGWIAKSDVDFQKELCLKRYSVRAAREMLLSKDLIETDLRKFSGAPTQHYRVRMDQLDKQWRAFIIGLSENGQSDYAKTDNPGLSENEQSLTEITTETTKQDDRFAAISQSLALLTGGTLNATSADLISTWLEKHTVEWVLKAIEIAKDKKAKSANYVDRILIGWEANGYPKSREDKVRDVKQDGSKKPVQTTSSRNKDIVRKAAQNATR
jgi:DnaD/phage-associated family protein